MNTYVAISRKPRSLKAWAYNNHGWVPGLSMLIFQIIIFCIVKLFEITGNGRTAFWAITSVIALVLGVIIARGTVRELTNGVINGSHKNVYLINRVMWDAWCEQLFARRLPNNSHSNRILMNYLTTLTQSQRQELQTPTVPYTRPHTRRWYADQLRVPLNTVGGC